MSTQRTKLSENVYRVNNVIVNVQGKLSQLTQHDSLSSADIKCLSELRLSEARGIKVKTTWY